MTDALDGNVAAGVLAELFDAEVTVALITCDSCGDERPLAELQAYVDAPGLVLRCASCEAVEIRIVRGPRHAWLDLRGARVLQIELPQ
jgi:Family of unknown function (DUF6510)